MRGFDLAGLIEATELTFRILAYLPLVVIPVVFVWQWSRNDAIQQFFGSSNPENFDFTLDDTQANATFILPKTWKHEVHFEGILSEIKFLIVSSAIVFYVPLVVCMYVKLSTKNQVGIVTSAFIGYVLARVLLFKKFKALTNGALFMVVLFHPLGCCLLYYLHTAKKESS